MNKTALKNFATWARRALIEAVTLRAFAMGLTEKNVKDGSLLPSDKFLTPKGQLLSDTQRSQRDQLVGNIRTQGFEQVMEAAAYTWFNRLIALRYMEHKGLLPISQKLFPLAPGQTPEVLPQALRLSIPAWSNEYSILLKDSALAFTIGVMEVMSRTRSVASTTHQPLPLSLLAGAIFFFLTWAGIKALKRLEAKVRIPGYAHQGTL